MPQAEHAFWYIQAKDLITLAVLLVTVFAIVWGPIKAVQVARTNDEEREAQRRKFGIFHDLMKTRRFVLNPMHVMALNLIQVEFYKHERIDASYKHYMGLLSRSQPHPRDPNFEQFYTEQEDALYDLLHEIGAELGYSYDKRDLRKLAYGPRGWEDEELQTKAMRAHIIDLLQGRRPLPVTWFKGQKSDDKYPPPPA